LEHLSRFIQVTTTGIHIQERGSDNNIVLESTPVHVRVYEVTTFHFTETGARTKETHGGDHIQVRIRFHELVEIQRILVKAALCIAGDHERPRDRIPGRHPAEEASGVGQASMVGIHTEERIGQENIQRNGVFGDVGVEEHTCEGRGEGSGAGSEQREELSVAIVPGRRSGGCRRSSTAGSHGVLLRGRGRICKLQALPLELEPSSVLVYSLHGSKQTELLLGF
jgi:hypothetical protein